MRKDNKNKTPKKHRKWLEVLRWILIVVLLVVGLALIFNKSIRNTVIAWNTNKYQVSKVAIARLFIMTADGEKLAEVPYRQYLESLTEGIYMLDAKYVLVDPISPETLKQILARI